MFTLAPPRARRRPSLTPMIDVVFLLLVFFMLAARFGQEARLELGLAGIGSEWSGPPRLVDVLPEGQRLNGIAQDMDGLLNELETLTSDPSDTVILRAREDAPLQRLVTVIEALRDAGFSHIAVLE